MKTTEKRIGNYVYGINRRSEIHIPDELPLKVLQIELFNTYVLPLDQNPATCVKWFKITNEDLSPIPLTEEWLLKFGFEKTTNEYYDKNNGLVIWIDGQFINIEWKDRFLISYTYVHQLQNLYFALTNTELEIK